MMGVVLVPDGFANVMIFPRSAPVGDACNWYGTGSFDLL